MIVKSNDVSKNQLAHASDWRATDAGTRRERWVILLLIWTVCLVYLVSMTVADPDLWGHTLYGLRSIKNGVLTESVDPFSFTEPGTPWINHEWLTEYSFGYLYSAMGGLGLWLWKLVMAVAILAVGVCALRRERASLPAAAMLLVFTVECLSGFFIFVRPQLATFVLFGLTLYVLRGFYDRPSKAIWILPLLMLPWVNLHGGFLAGLALQGLFLAAWTVRALTDRGHRPEAAISFLVLALSIATTFCNPYGYGLHAMLWQHLVPAQAIREWLPMWATNPLPAQYLPFLLVLLACRSRKLKWIDWAVVAAVAIQAVWHIRHTALFGVTTLILLPGPLSDGLARIFPKLTQRWTARRSWRLRFIGVAAVCITLTCLHLPATTAMWRAGIAPWQIAVESARSAPGIPVRAMAVLRQENLRGNLITSYGWAQYAIWALHPECRIAFDGRYRTVFSRELEDEFLAFQLLDAGSPQVTPILDRYGTDIALLPANTGPCRYLSTRTDWRPIYQDKQAALFVRDLPQFQAVIEKASLGPLAPPSTGDWNAFPAASRSRRNFATPRLTVVIPFDESVGWTPSSVPRIN